VLVAVLSRFDNWNRVFEEGSMTGFETIWWEVFEKLGISEAVLLKVCNGIHVRTFVILV
jgi:hypothetical protein